MSGWVCKKRPKIAGRWLTSEYATYSLTITAFSSGGDALAAPKTFRKIVQFGKQATQSQMASLVSNEESFNSFRVSEKGYEQQFSLQMASVASIIS